MKTRILLLVLAAVALLTATPTAVHDQAPAPRTVPWCPPFCGK